MISHKNYGSYLRATQRRSLHDNAKQIVSEKMRILIYRELKSLLTSPVDEELYGFQLSSILRSMKENFGDLKQLKLAHAFLATHIDRGNKNGDWNLPIPPTLTSVPRARKSRTASEFNASAQLGKVHNDWRQSLLGESRKKMSSERLLADALLSAMFYGGLARKQAVTAFANQLISAERPLKSFTFPTQSLYWSDLFWFYPKRDAINFLSDEEELTYYRFYLDPFTLSLTHNYLTNRDSLSSKLNMQDVWALITKRLNKVTKVNLDFDMFCYNTLGVSEMLAGVNLPQALIECAKGKIKNSSLPPENFEAWVKGINSTFKNPYAGLRTRNISDIIDKIEYSGVTTASYYDKFINQVRRSLRSTISKDNKEKRTPNDAINELSQIDQTSLSQNVQILLGWTIRCLRTLALSSVYRYFSEVYAAWLTHTDGVDLLQLDEYELESLYTQILNNRLTPNAQNYLLGRLKDLHLYASQMLSLPNLISFFNSKLSATSLHRVRAGYIPYNAFLGLVKDLKFTFSTELTANEIANLQVLLILAYRTGLRISELLKLRLIDVENSQDLFIFIVNNKYGNNKTNSALRQLPLKALLKQNEYDFTSKHIKQRRIFFEKHEASTNLLLFSKNATPTIPYDSSFLNRYVQQTLSSYGFYNLTFHHFRHSAISNLFLELEDPEHNFPEMHTYNQELNSKLTSGIYSDASISREKYWAIACTAGHLTPETTFSNYIHFVDLILYKTLSCYNPPLGIDEARNISGLSTMSLNTLRNSNGLIPLHDIRQLLPPKLSKFTQKIKASSKQRGQEEISQDNKQTSTHYYIKPDVELCYSILKKIEAGNSIAKTSLEFRISEEVIKKWIKTAQALFELETSRQNKRLFSNYRVQQALSKELPLFSPSKPISNAEVSFANKTITKMRSEYSQNSEEIKWIISYWLNNSMYSNSGIRFTETHELKRFLECVYLFLPAEHWRLEFNLPLKTEDFTWRLKQDKQGVVFIDDWPLDKNVSPSINRIKAAKSTSGYLFLKHPNEKIILSERNKKMKKYSTSVLRYIFHMLAIMLGVN